MKNGVKMGKYGRRGRPKSPQPKTNVIVFLVDDAAKTEWEAFQKYFIQQKKPKHKQEIFRFMIASGYKNLG